MEIAVISAATAVDEIKTHVLDWKLGNSDWM